MTAAEPIFPSVFAPFPALVVNAPKVIETVGVEVLDDSPASAANDSKTPANHADVIPFASTLRRVG